MTAIVAKLTETDLAFLILAALLLVLALAGMTIHAIRDVRIAKHGGGMKMADDPDPLAGAAEPRRS
jgi:hypothetical protein